MLERFYQGSEDEGPEAIGHRFRRGRRHTPPGERFPRARNRPHRAPDDWSSVPIGDVVAELTQRQAVVWLMNLDTMISLYESTTGQMLDSDARERLITTLRGIVADPRK